jgi:hypothetical protein
MGDGLPLLPSLSCWTHPQSPGESETRMVSRQPIAERARRADLDVNRRRARPAPYVEREVPYCQVWPQLTTGVAQPGRQSQRPRPSADAHPQPGPTTVASPCWPMVPPNRASTLGSAQFDRPPTTLASLSTAMNATLAWGKGRRTNAGAPTISAYGPTGLSM